MFVKRKKNRSGTISVVIAEKFSGRYSELVTIGIDEPQDRIDERQDRIDCLEEWEDIQDELDDLRDDLDNHEFDRNL